LTYIPTNQVQLKLVTHKNTSAFLRRCFKFPPLVLFSDSLPIRPRYQTAYQKLRHYQRCSRAARTSTDSTAGAHAMRSPWQKESGAVLDMDHAALVRSGFCLCRLTQRDDFRSQLRLRADPFDSVRHRGFDIFRVADFVALENAVGFVTSDYHRNVIRES
jgi:hypothetical protein